MKKIYFWALGLGVIIGISYLFLRKEINKEIFVGNNNQEQTKQNVSGGQKTEVGIKGEGNKEIKEQIMGEVVKWDSKNGVLTAKLNNSQRELKIIPGEMVIYVPVAQKKTNQIIMINAKDNVNWETAFCDKDSLTVGYDGDKILRMVVNTGYRACGYQEN